MTLNSLRTLQNQTISNNNLPTQTKAIKTTTIEPIVEATLTSQKLCDWRPEPLRGKCDTMQSTTESQAFATANECQQGCCNSQSCFAYQFRTKEGCLFANRDARLGAEKDGVSGWCEPRAPAAWHGQWTRDRQTKDKIVGACSSKDDGNTEGQQPTWNPNELAGQCFGLGSRRTVPEHTARACQQACCQDAECGIWQWRVDAGCFYHKSGHSCQPASDPLDLEAFVGQRKVQPGRSYTPYAYSKDFADLAGTELDSK